MVSYEELEGIGRPSYEALRSIWNSWSQDLIKATILQTVFIHLKYDYFLGFALCQRWVCSSPPMRNSLLKCLQDTSGSNGAVPNQMPSLVNLNQLYRLREIWSSPISDTQEEGTSSSSCALAPEGHASAEPGGA